MWNFYFSPEDLQAALQILGKDPDRTRLIAGGTDLVLDLNHDRLPAVETVVDISRIHEIKEITLNSDHMIIGSAVTFSEMIKSDLIKKHANLLSDAARKIAGIQIRNVATIGGNIVNASPAADMIPPLLVLDSSVIIVDTRKKIREVPLAKFLLGYRKVDLYNNEVVTGFKFAVPEIGTLQYFRKVQNRRSMAISVLNLSVLLKTNDGYISHIKIAMGALAPTPVRVKKVEEKLWGLPVIEAHNPEIYRGIRHHIAPISDIRASQEYRCAVAQDLLQHAVTSMLGLEGQPSRSS